MKSSDFPQLALMRQGVAFHFKISLRAFEVMVRPLSNLEIIQCMGAAADAFTKLPQTQQTSVTLSLLQAMYQLERASAHDVGDVGQLSLALLQQMHNEEVNTLWKQYVRMIDKVNPSFEEMPLADVEALVDELKKNSEPKSILTDLSISNLIAVTSHLLRMPAD